jgi:hypothetical protein
MRVSLSSFISRRPQSSGRSAGSNRRFKFQKSRQLFIRVHNETLSIVAIQIVRPSRSRADTHPELQPAFLRLSACSRHCLLFNTTPNDSEQHGGNDSSPSQEGPVKIKLTSQHQLCRAGRVFPL